MNLTAATAYVRRYLQQLTPDLSYHNAGHTLDDVLPACLRLARHYPLSQEQHTLLATAALFHDVGYVQQYDKNEALGAAWAHKILPSMGYRPRQIDTISRLILVTALPQTPTNLLEQIICDADLDSLWREDFLQRSHDLRAELACHNQVFSDRQWWLKQADFLHSHRYFCAAESASRNAGKQRNILQVRTLLAASSPM